jgi:hypothetical protein
MRKSDLQLAKDTHDIEYLKKKFEEARKTIEAGGTVRVEQAFSDAHVETLHIISSLDELRRLEKLYLDPALLD